MRVVGRLGRVWLFRGESWAHDDTEGNGIKCAESCQDELLSTDEKKQSASMRSGGNNRKVGRVTRVPRPKCEAEPDAGYRGDQKPSARSLAWVELFLGPGALSCVYEGTRPLSSCGQMHPTTKEGISQEMLAPRASGASATSLQPVPCPCGARPRSLLAHSQELVCISRVPS